MCADAACAGMCVQVQLSEYTITSVTEGIEALAFTRVSIRPDGGHADQGFVMHAQVRATCPFPFDLDVYLFRQIVVAAGSHNQYYNDAFCCYASACFLLPSRTAILVYMHLGQLVSSWNKFHPSLYRAQPFNCCPCNAKQG